MNKNIKGYWNKLNGYTSEFSTLRTTCSECTKQYSSLIKKEIKDTTRRITHPEYYSLHPKILLTLVKRHLANQMVGLHGHTERLFKRYELHELEYFVYIHLQL